MTAFQSRVPAFVLAATAFLAAPVAPATPEAEARATGKFTSGKVSFQVGGAYAFWSRKPEDRLIEVAVSNDPFRAEAFDAFYDPQPVISSRFADEETAVVYFEFEPNGKYHGLSYYFGSGNGCGFCYDSKVVSTVRVEGQRLRGRLAYEEPNRQFDVDLDVPIAPAEWGKPITGEGAEIGNAFREFNAAWEKEDRQAIFALFNSARQERWKKRQQEGKLDAYVAYLAEDVHWNLKDAHIVGGYVRSDQAVLLVRGRNSFLDHFHGQVTLTREKGRWKIGDEVYEVGE